MIKSVMTNIKTCQGVLFETPYVLIVGPNGSGKSAIIHAIEAACCQQVWDMGGKNIKKKGDLDRLAREGDNLPQGVEAIVRLDDDEVMTYGDKTKKFRNVIQDALDALTGSSISFCRYIIANGKWVAFDPKGVDHPSWERLTETLGSRRALLKLEEITRKALSTHRGQLKELDAALKHVNLPHLRDLQSQNRAQEETSKQVLSEIHTIMADYAETILSWSSPSLIEQHIPSGMPPLSFSITKNTFHMGFDGASAPSGAETIMLAVALAATFGSFDGTDDIIFILPDRSYDEVTLAKIMRVLRSVPAQGVFVQSAVMPAIDGNLAEYNARKMGWSVIELTG
jgi:hypothetical protein